MVWGVLRDLESSALEEKEKALFRFIDKVNHDSPRIAPGDMQPLYAAGWTDAEGNGGAAAAANARTVPADRSAHRCGIAA